MKLSEIVIALNKISGDNGFGRLDLVEDRLVGLKSRECYEVPGALTLITAHKALEDICVEATCSRPRLSSSRIGPPPCTTASGTARSKTRSTPLWLTPRSS